MRYAPFFVLLLLLASAPCLAQPEGYSFIRHKGRVARHPVENLPWRVYLSDGRHYEAVLHSMRTWNAAGHRLGFPDLFAPVTSRGDADMVVDWSGQGLPRDKAAGVWWNFGDEVKISKMVVDPKHKIPEGNRAQILLQELGHCLGLGDSTHKRDVMHPIMHTRRYRSVKSAKLTKRDLEAFRWLYSQENFSPIVNSARKQSKKVETSQPTGVSANSLQIDPIRVDLNASVNIRITVRNPSPETLRAPLELSLYARVRGDNQWRLLKSWSGISKIVTGHRLSRDYFDEMSPLFQGPFELMARVRRIDSDEVLAERLYP